MPKTMTYTGRLTVCSCWCGIHVAIPEDLYRMARDGKNAAYCPVGHTFIWNVDALAKARRRAERAEAEAARERARRDQAEAEASEERARTAAARAEVNRTRKRIAGGACPCCNRTFVKLHQHMKTSHPDFLDMAVMPDDFANWYAVEAVAEVVRRSDEPLTPAMVHGRLVLAGRRNDNLPSVTAALYAAERTRGLVRVAPSTWASPA